MEKILINSCLLGQAVRYDGGHNLLQDEWMQQWQREGRIVAFCPECAGGLPTPRPAAERVGDLVLTAQGEDVTVAFRLGAQKALALVQQQGIKVAILKARSPSCGNQHIYDGTFSKHLIEGQGITAELLQAAGVSVFNETELVQAATRLAELEAE
ncbi:DUF523 domain-containing protein [Shewanella sp.]|uniref:DUF523 domain-containing protein n=1 Tax=Shewanella sp. TaxID=50422 RepID=UPI003A886F59